MSKATIDYDQSLAGKNIVLAVTGSIAVFKACVLARSLVNAQARLRIVMSKNATRFVQPLSFSYISRHPVGLDEFRDERGRSIDHIELARWMDLLVIAPASANRIAHLALGLADDLLGTCVLATTAPVLLAPAMNQQMWKQPIVRKHIERLTRRGWHIAKPQSGSQACGEVGPGRMLEPEALYRRILHLFRDTIKVPASASVGNVAEDGVSSAANKTNSSPALEARARSNFLLTMGATREYLDPVRYISNNSSGRMGLSLQLGMQALGLAFHTVCGKIDDAVHQQQVAHNLLDRITYVVAGDEMLEAVLECVERQKPKVFIGAAAVCDYKAAKCRDQKIKSTGDPWSITMAPNPDIIATVKRRYPDVFCIAFAAETENYLDNGMEKLRSKAVDMVVVNSVGVDSKVDSFGTNSIHSIILQPDREPEDVGGMTKADFSYFLLDEILRRVKSPGRSGDADGVE